MLRWRNGARGASLVEYACLLLATTVAGGAMMRTVGPMVKQAGAEAVALLMPDGGS